MHGKLEAGGLEAAEIAFGRNCCTFQWICTGVEPGAEYAAFFSMCDPD